MNFKDHMREILKREHVDEPAPREESVVIEPARRPDGSPLNPIYWQRSTGEIVGPAQPECLVQLGLGIKSTDFWVIADYQGLPIWIRSDCLRSQQQFETQVKPIVVDPIKDLQLVDFLDIQNFGAFSEKTAHTVRI